MELRTNTEPSRTSIVAKDGLRLEAIIDGTLVMPCLRTMCLLLIEHHSIDQLTVLLHTSPLGA
jgi:hypothetical protein